MRVRVHIDQEGFRLNELFDGATAEQVVAAVKDRISRDVPFVLRIGLSRMSPVGFAQEVVRRYNKSEGQNLPLPTDCAQFLDQAQKIGVAEIVQP